MSPENQQPPQPTVQPQPMQTIPQSPNQVPKDPGHELGIASLVLAFFIAPLGLILGFIAMHKSKKAGIKNTIALIGTILSGLATVAIIIVVILMATLFTGLVNKCADLGPGVHYVDGVQYSCNTVEVNN